MTTHGSEPLSPLPDEERERRVRDLQESVPGGLDEEAAEEATPEGDVSPPSDSPPA